MQGRKQTTTNVAAPFLLDKAAVSVMAAVEDELWRIFTFYTLRGNPPDLARLPVRFHHNNSPHQIGVRSTAAILHVWILQQEI